MAVPVVLQEALEVRDKGIQNELTTTQDLVWRYTAVLEKLTYPDIQSGQRDVPIILLKQALYNVRQQEVYLKILQVRQKLSITLKHIVFTCNKLLLVGY